MHDILQRSHLQPVLLGKLLQLFGSEVTVRHNEAATIVAALISTLVLNILYMSHYSFLCYHAGLRMKSATSAILYKKLLKTDITEMQRSKSGKMINIFSSDVGKFDQMLYYAHLMWSSLTLGVITSVLIVREIGFDGLFGVAVVLVVCPIQSWTGTLTTKFREKSAGYGDQRVKLMSEIVAGIETIKLQVWEKPFQAMATKLRNSELGWIVRASYVRALYMTFSIFTTRMALFATVLVYIVNGNRLSADKVFVISTLYSIMSNTLAGVFIRGVAELSEIKVSVGRIEEFLSASQSVSKEAESKNDRGEENAKLLSKEEKDLIYIDQGRPPGAVFIDNLTARWSEKGEFTLKNINLEVEPGSLVAVIGAVGSGKSSLIQALLGELKSSSGKSAMEARAVSYSSQEPWIFSGSIRENILFGRAFDNHRYNQVLKACGLLPDLKRMSSGDATLVGERGGALSGGQKARVTLARAAYATQVDAYLLDEPLAALDASVAKHVFENCIVGLLGNSTRILVTNQVHLLRKADLIVVMDKGAVVAQGKFDNETMNDLIKGFQPVLIEESENLVETKDEKVFNAHEDTVAKVATETIRRAKVPLSQYIAYWTESKSYMSLLLLVLLFFMTQCIVSCSDFWVTVCISKDYNATVQANVTSHSFSEIIYSFAFFNCLNVYSTLILLLFLIALGRSLLYFKIAKLTSKNVHDSMLSSTINAEYEFFLKTPSGTIMNRFSSDLLAVDVPLPRIMLDTIQYLTLIAGSLFIIFAISPLLVLPVAVFLFVILNAKEYYLKTSRVLKRVDAALRSPIYTHLSDTIDGIVPIRAFRNERRMERELFRLLDRNFSASFLLFGTSTAFGFFLDVIGVTCVAILIVYLVIYSRLYSSEIAGLALTQAISITALLQWSVRQSAETENLMTNFERAKEYTKLKQESIETPQLAVSKKWPVYGRIRFDGVSVKPEGKLSTLRNVNIEISPQEKIGIIGRTGAGKSSLVKALFRLVKYEGKITIDGINIASVCTQKLRKNISMIPQDPIIFTGSVRKNLDPGFLFSDKKLFNVIHAVGLSDIVEGPDYVSEGVDLNLSVGQKQLLCLARALLRNNKIIVLDEATANIDIKTDSLIQTLLNERFANRTVLTIAHRPQSVRDCGRVIVLDKGEIVQEQ
ncbi:ABC transporter C family member 8-like isoform X2 [Cloeon dipterum]|uniref:ABC transporter C family member 8-like isoform X2 n=1 Tax=Cloeon dipterum TaxID=197152 RepID=UPI00322036BB